MPRSIPMKLRVLAMNFIGQFNIMPGHPGAPHITLTSQDLDNFGIAYGLYGSAASDPELNAERAKLVARLNKAGSAPSWTKAQDGFQVVVHQRSNAGIPTIWVVKPLEVAISHIAVAMPSKNLKTITNRAIKVDSMYGSLPKLKDRDEQRAIDDMRNAAVGWAQLQVTITQNQMPPPARR